MVIAFELQAHGYTKDINRPLSFTQDADDVAALSKELKIKQADFLGFSNGGSTVMQIVIRDSDQVRKIIVCSSFYKRSGTYPQVTFDKPDTTLMKLFTALIHDFL